MAQHDSTILSDPSTNRHDESGGEGSHGAPDSDRKRKKEAVAATDSAPAEETPPPLAENSGLKNVVRGFGACTISMVVHLVGLIALALVMVDDSVKNEVREIVAAMFEQEEDALEEIQLEQEIEAATEISSAIYSSAPAAGLQGTVSGGADSQMTLDQKVVKNFAESATADVNVNAPTLGMLSSSKLIEAVPDGALGDPRAIVDSYEQAMDRITQEIMWMLDKGDVLVIWCFDQSESMKDDQVEIRNRIDRVYSELGLATTSDSDHLLTAVTSYGGNFAVHTEKPTSDRDEIRAAIANVPVDPSGKEFMCEAVGLAVQRYRELKKRRQLALILVTDESGEWDNNDQYLERAIAEAKAAKCRIYTLGREAVFGYPFAHFRWVHPQTKHVHWLPVNRGPETAFPEQLQTNGFRRRYDAFGSGFGPYEQTRMTRETGGIFFMLPSVEANIVRGDKRNYELEALRPYRPDLRAKMEVLAERDQHPLRTLIWSIVHDLDPWNKKAQSVVELRTTFSREFPKFRQQALQEQRKVILQLQYMALAQKKLEEGKQLREQEADPRWQGNYDLMHAQLVAYQARNYEYGAALEDFMQNPKTVPLTKSPNLTMVHWDITVKNREPRTEEAKPYIERSKELFQKVIDNHPGTPWAARASQEMKRGFSVELVPDYDGPHPKVSNPSPIPKL